MGNPNDKFVHVTWSGGIDSTAVIGQLLLNGYAVQPVTLVFGRPGYRDREAVARGRLTAWFENRYPETFFAPIMRSGHFLDSFEEGGLEGAGIPRRNKHILDFMMTNYVMPSDGYYLAMGEYIGADTWLVKDHVGAHDADSRYLASYMLLEYGLGYRFMALNDFGESRYKSDRVQLLVDAVGEEAALWTSNCMFGTKEAHCGKCYKCVERHVAFELVLGPEVPCAVFENDPVMHPAYEAYRQQMAGSLVDMKWEEVNV